MNAVLLALGLRSALLLLAGGATTLVLRNGSAASRNAVWRFTVLGLLLLPVMFVRLPRWDVPVEHVPVMSVAMRYVQEPPLRKEPIPAVTAVAPPVLQQDHVRLSAPPQGPIDWLSFLAAAWALAAFISLIPLLLGLAALARTIRRSRELELLGFAELCAEMSIRRTVELRISADIQTPAAAGLIRPMVLLPKTALDWDPARLNMVLRHELAHVQRHDWMARILTHLTCVVYAPNPLVWLASARLRAESEAACDDLVIAGGVSARDYARELLEIARSVRSSSLGIATVGMAHRSKVEARLLAIVDPQRRRSSVSRCAFASLALCGLLTAGLVASFRLVSSRSKTDDGASVTTHDSDDMPFPGSGDDIPDHPTVPAVARGAKMTFEPFVPGAEHVVVAQNGVAHLPNGVTVSLNGITPSATDSPIWTVANREIPTVRMSRNRSFVGYGLSGDYFQSLDRNLHFSIESSKTARASTMGYLLTPIQPVKYKRAVLFPSTHDVASNDFRLGPDSLHTIHVQIPGPPKIDRATYRVGVATGEWRSVMNVPNPFHASDGGRSAPVDSKKPYSIDGRNPDWVQGGVLDLTRVPSIIGPGRPPQPIRLLAGQRYASQLVARRALILDANGNVIRSGYSDQVGWYPLNRQDLRRCTRIVIQERQYEFAEFRNIPLRPNLEAEAKKAAGSLITGTAKGIAPGYEKTIAGIGTVALVDVVSARKQGTNWTDDAQPHWRADGKVLAEPMPASGPTSAPFWNESENTPPTNIRFSYSGAPWHKVNSRVRIEGDNYMAPGIPGGLLADVRWNVVHAFATGVREATVAIDIADGPWKVVASQPVHIEPLPKVSNPHTNRTHTGLVLCDGDQPSIVILAKPSVTLGPNAGQPRMLPVPPADTAHRFVLVLKDGTEIQAPSAYQQVFPDRLGEDPTQESFFRLMNRPYILASEVKEIRYEVRPITRTVRFEHVAVKPES